MILHADLPPLRTGPVNTTHPSERPATEPCRLCGGVPIWTRTIKKGGPKTCNALLHPCPVSGELFVSRYTGPLGPERAVRFWHYTQGKIAKPDEGVPL